MYLHHLRYFLTLARLEHYTEAAEALSITQPTLSHAISSIEKDLGVPLFEKKGRNVVLTKYGKIFYMNMEKAIKNIDSTITELKEVGSGEGLIDLAFLQVLGTHFIPRIVKDFLEENQEKNFRFRFYTGSNVTQNLVEGLKEGTYDLVLCSKQENEPNIEFTPVAKQELVVIVPLNHPLAKKDCIDLSETISYPQIAFTKSSGLRPIVDDLFKKIGKEYLINYEIKDDQVIAGFVSQGFGIAVVPNMPILSSLDVKVLKINNPNPDRYFYLATKKNTYLTPAVKALKKFIINNAQL